MKSTSTLKQGLRRVDQYWRGQDFALAWEEVNKLLEEWPFNPHLLLLQAELAQLPVGDVGLTLADIKARLKLAVALDGDAPAPLIELGHFYFAVEDDAEKAARCFQNAITVCLRSLREARQGQNKALLELERAGNADQAGNGR